MPVFQAATSAWASFSTSSVGLSLTAVQIVSTCQAASFEWCLTRFAISSPSFTDQGLAEVLDELVVGFLGLGRSERGQDQDRQGRVQGLG